MTQRNPLKAILTDIVGIILIIGSILFGWVPGPGGIPLFLAGLGLLAQNHEWARRLLERVKKNGLSFINKIFVKSPVWQAAYDLLTIFLFGTAIYLINTRTKNWMLAASISMIATGLALFLGNRQRLHRLTSKFKRKH